MKERDKVEITEQFVKVLNANSELEKKPKDYGSGELLYSSEIHTIQAIAKNKNLHMTKLSQILGVTKGAISQIITKLAKKELVEKVKDSENNSKVILCLTNKGKIAYYGHEYYHEKMDKELMNYLSTIDEKHGPLLRDLFHELENWIRKCLVTDR